MENLPLGPARANVALARGVHVEDRLFAGRYLMKRRLGLGGMAEVWLAEMQGPQGFSRELVIKRILPHLADDENFLRMFEDEARLAARLNHPHAVRVEELGKEEGTWYLAMEYLDGADLRALARRARGLRQDIPIEVILQMGADVASALDHAHSLQDDQGRPLNLIHRDVSPHNVLVTRSGLAKLVDFGIARAESNQVKTRTGMVKGKSGYMSPEQALGRDLDGRSDQFALGIVLYELLLRARLFRGDSDMAIMRKVVACEIPPLMAIAPEIPEAVQAVVNKALQRAPEDRYPSCKEFSEALFGCLHDLGLRGGHQKVAAWVETMLNASVVIPQLPSVDDLIGGAPIKEELTQLSSHSSTHAARMRSASRNEPVAGDITELTAPADRGSQALLWGSLAAGLLVVVALAINLRVAGDEAVTAPSEARTNQVISAPEKKAEPITIRSQPPAAQPKKPPPARDKPVAQPKPSPTKRPQPKAVTSTPAVAPTSTVKIHVDVMRRGRPEDWGIVFLNGRARGRAPVRDVVVPTGSLKICVENKAFGLALRKTAQVAGNNMRLAPLDMSKASPGTCP